MVNIWNIYASTLNQDIAIMTLPSGYHPQEGFRICGTSQVGQLQSLNNALFYSFDSDGKVRTYTYNSINGGQVFAVFIIS